MNKGLTTLGLLLIFTNSMVRGDDDRMTDSKTTLFMLKNAMDVFLTERDWYQFHNPKVDSNGPVVESSELLALFLFSKPEAGGVDILSAKREQVEDEFGDVISWLLCFALNAKVEVTKSIGMLYSKSDLQDDAVTTITHLRSMLSDDQNLSIVDAACDLSVVAARFMDFFRRESNDGRGNDVVEAKFEQVERLYAELWVAALTFARKSDIDLSAAFKKKLEKTKLKYPVEKARGNASKYTDL